MSMFDDLWDFFKFMTVWTLVFVIIGALILGAGVGLAVFSEQNRCKTMQMLHDDFEFQWVMWGGCRVKTPSGYWIHIDRYEYLEGDVR